MNLLAPISTFMSTELVTVHPDDTLDKVETKFNNHNIHHIIVSNEGSLEGIISKSDYLFFRRSSVLKKSVNSRLQLYKAKEIMTSKIARMDHDQKVDIALAIFNENLFHAIPVMKDDKVVGIVTTFDFIKQLYRDKGIDNKYVKG